MGGLLGGWGGALRGRDGAGRGLVVGDCVGGFVRGPVTLSRFARRFWFCPYGTTGFGFLDGRPVGTKGICWVDRDSVTGVFGGRRRVSLVDGG